MEFTKLTRRGRERIREVFTGRRASSLSEEDEPKPTQPVMSLAPHDFPVGRDPRTMTQDELRAMGHEPTSLIAIIRVKCLDCCAGSPNEVRLCVAMACPAGPSVPVRMFGAPQRPRRSVRRHVGRWLRCEAPPTLVFYRTLTTKTLVGYRTPPKPRPRSTRANPGKPAPVLRPPACQPPTQRIQPEHFLCNKMQPGTVLSDTGK